MYYACKQYNKCLKIAGSSNATVYHMGVYWLLAFNIDFWGVKNHSLKVHVFLVTFSSEPCFLAYLQGNFGKGAANLKSSH